MTLHPPILLSGPVRAVLVVALLATLLLAGSFGQPELDRDAIRGAGTAGSIVVAQAEGEAGAILHRIDAASGEARTIREERQAWLFSPTWSSDGRTLAVARVESRQARIEILDRDGRSRRKIAVGAVPWLAWRPGEAQLAVASSLHGGQEGIHLFDLGSGRWELLTQGGQAVWLAWSADGQQLAFSRLEPERRIYVLDLPTRQERVLCTGVIPAWDPEGGRLAVVTPARDGIELVDAKSGRCSRLVSDVAPGRLVWSPDGRYLLTDDVRARTLLLADVKTAALTRIGRPGGLLYGYAWAAATERALTP